MNNDRIVPEHQLAWSREQMLILDAIDERLLKMHEIAQYGLNHEVSIEEGQALNEQVALLQAEIKLLQISIVPWEESGFKVLH